MANKRKAQIREEFCKISYVDSNILHVIEEYDFTFKGTIENKWKFANDRFRYSVDHLEIFPDGKIASTSNTDIKKWSKINMNQDGRKYKEFLKSSICCSIFALSDNLLVSATSDELSVWNLEMQTRYFI